MNSQYELFSEIKQPKELQTFKIYKDSKNKIWVGTNEGLKLVSALQKNKQSSIFTLLPAPFNIPALKSDRVTDMLEDANGIFWITTTHGLVKIDPGGSWQLFTEKDGLPSSIVLCIYQDRVKNIWIGTSLGLVKLVTKNDIRIYTIENGLTSNAVRFLLPVNNDLLLASGGTGLQLFNTTKENFSAVSSNFLYTGFVQNSRPLLFFRNNNQFGKYDPVNRLIANYISSGPPINITYCSVMDANGIIFNGTHTGLLIRSGNKSWFDKKLPYRITDLHIDKKGYLWVGTWNNGLFRIHYANTKNKSDSPDPITVGLVKERINLSVQDFSNLLPDKNIRSVFEDNNGNMWIGMRYNGIVQLKNNGKDQYDTLHFDLRNGLTSNFIGTIAEDMNGCIWIGSNKGIDKLIPAGKGFRVFNFSRVNNYFASITKIVPWHDHSLWFGTFNGLVNIIDGETEKTPPTPVYITSVNLGDTSFNYNTYQADTKLQLSYYQNQARFEFSAPSFINEKQMLYRYRLLGGADTIWSEPANLHNVSYASLQPGHYRFEVRTIGWNEELGTPANFSFIIRPPYWQTWWFYAFVGLLMVSVFYALYFYRIRQLLKLQKIRNNIASDLHDDIGSTLTNISILSELSNKNLDQPLVAQKYLQRITEEVNESGQALDDIIWSVNSNNDTLEEMLVRMRRFAAELFDHTSTRCYLELQPDAAGKKLSMEQRRDLYLVFKESLNNIYKHATAQTVWINLSMIDHSIKLQIRDDGKGFNPEATTHRNGLNNLKTRVEKWKGKLMINSRPGTGSNIEIIMPVVSQLLK
jgi:ligand-binding sensor domain-containing protein/two-component sensor histidine kinase